MMHVFFSEKNGLLFSKINDCCIMKANFRHNDSTDSAASGPQSHYDMDAIRLDAELSIASRIDDREQQLNSVGSSSSMDASWDQRQSSTARFMSQEGVLQLTKDLRKFSEALTALKVVFLEEKDTFDKTVRVLAHERLGELLQVLKILVDKYSDLNSTEILPAAGFLIKHVKDFNYENDNSSVSPEIFRAINNLAMVFSNSVSECLMGDAHISPNLSVVQSPSFEGLESVNVRPRHSEPDIALNFSPGSAYLSSEAAVPDVSGSENVDDLLYQMESGLEMAFDRAKILSKYLNDLITFVKKKAHLEMEHAKNLLKLSQSTKPALSEQSFLPFQSLYCTSLDHDREYASNCLSMYQSSLLQQKFIEPLLAKKNEHDKKRKSIREVWMREKKRSEESIMAMKKAKQTYQTRVVEYQKAKEAAIKAEGDQMNQQTNAAQQSHRPPLSVGSLYPTSSSGKMDKKKRLEEDTNLKATQAEMNYRAYVNEANKRLRELDKHKVSYIQQLRELITQCDQTAKTVTIAYFQHHYQLFSPLPIQFQAMCEDAKRYEPGYQYSDYIRNLPAQPTHSRLDFEFESYSTGGSSYLISTGITKLHESDDVAQSPKPKGTRATNKTFSDTESSSSRSLDDLSPSASPGDFSRSTRERRDSAEGSLSSEELLDDGKDTGTGASLSLSGNAPTPDASPVALRHQISKQAGKIAGNLKGAFKNKKHKSSLFGVDFSVAAQSSPDGIPFLIKCCIAEIDNRALCTKGIYRVNGVKNRVEKLCAQFDLVAERIDLTQHTPHDISGVLKYFLRQLPEPLMQFRFYKSFLDIAKDYQNLINSTNDAANQAKEDGRPAPAQPEKHVLDSFVTKIRDTVEQLPIENKNTLQYIISHLTRIAYHSRENKMSASNLAIVFGPTLMRPVSMDGNESLKTLIDMPYQSRIVEMLIVHKDFIFGTFSHQAGNIFPFSGFQPSLSLSGKSSDVGTFTSQDSVNKITSGMNMLSSTEGGKTEDKDVSEGDVLLDFGESSTTEGNESEPFSTVMCIKRLPNAYLM
ncbi:unnamed protein product [Clavelina lepadiformis]|uniref:Uncharacterized protein n=1 Tax=Clavelina lepadiformis TaxID=159417 RepID=A0ABP0G4L4_CLALP